MVVLTLLEKVYGPRGREALKGLERALSSVVSGVELEFRVVGTTERGWVQVEVSGEDEEVVRNYLSQKYGVALSSLEDLRSSTTLRCRVADSGKVGYGIYVDIGIQNPEPIDALIPLHTLRRQLVREAKLPTRKVLDLFCLYDNLPLVIVTTKVDVERREVEAALSQRQAAAFEQWLSSGLDRVVVLGAALRDVRRTVKEAGITKYVVGIERLGLLEHVLPCRRGTDAPGIIAKLGPHLPKIPLRAFSPRRVQDTLKRLASMGR